MVHAGLTTAMLMTAGLGTRLHPFTQVRTKALLPVLGIPSVQYTLDTLAAAGVKRVVANVHHLAQDTAKRLQELDSNGLEVKVKDESQLILGTAGGIRNALGELGPAPFFRANADVICDLDWSALLAAHQELRRSRGVVITLAVFRSGPKNANYPEILMDQKSELITGIGKPQSSRPFWTGAAVIEPEALLEVPSVGASEFVPQILTPAILSQRAGVFLSDGLWFDIGAPQLWLETHFDLMRRFEASDGMNDQVRLWQRRFIGLNHSSSPGCWSHSSCQSRPYSMRSSDQSPNYIGEGVELSQIRLQIGPNAVIYGPVPADLDLDSRFENAIAFGGYWVKK